MAQPNSKRNLTPESSMPPPKKRNGGRNRDLVNRYDPRSEILPRKAIYCEAFPRVEKNISLVCDIVLNACKDAQNLGFRSEAIDRVCKHFEKTRSPALKYPDVGPVAVLGPAGSGKSTTLNSLLNENLAFEHGGSERGTYVVHEFKQKLPNQTSPFIVVVHFRSKKQIRTDVQKHCKVLMEFCKTSQDSEELDEVDKLDRGESLDDIQKTAVDFFAYLFGWSDKAVIEFFKEQEPEENNSSDHIVNELLSRVEGLLKAHKLQHAPEEKVVREELYGQKSGETGDDASETEHYRAFTPLEMTGKLKSIVRPQANSEGHTKPTVWPVVGHVTIHQDNSILDKGVVLADTPGYNDQNLTVKNNTKSYLQTVSTCLVFHTCKRIEANSSLDELLRMCLHLVDPSRIQLVITMIDEMQEYGDGELDELPSEQAGQLRNAKFRMDQLAKAVIDLNDKKAEADDEDEVDPVEYRKLDQKIRKLAKEKAQVEAELNHITIQFRCQRIKNKLKGLLRKLARSDSEPDLQITFVSNAAYQENLKDYRETALPKLSAQLSGIPDLRRWLQGVPAYGKFETLQGICQNILPHNFNGMRGILTKTPLERKQEVGVFLERALYRIAEGLCGRSRQVLLEKFESYVIGLIDRESGRWVREASEWLDVEVVQIKSGQLATICKRGGVHTSKGKNAQEFDFIRDLQLVFKEDMDGAHETFRGETQDWLDGFNKSVQRNLQIAKDDVQNCPSASGQDLKPFFDYIDQSARILSSDLDRFGKVLDRSIEKTRYFTYLQSEDSHCGTVMSKTWIECTKIVKNIQDSPDAEVFDLPPDEKPKGRKPSIAHRRINHIRRAIQGTAESGNLYERIGEMARHSIECAINVWFKRATKSISHCVADIKKDFESRFADPSSSAQLTPAEKELNAKAEAILTAALDKACHTHENVILDDLKACMEYENQTPEETDVKMED